MLWLARSIPLFLATVGLELLLVTLLISALGLLARSFDRHAIPAHV